MSYVVIKTIKGRRYRYLQTSWREGKRVRTKSVWPRTDRRRRKKDCSRLLGERKTSVSNRQQQAEMERAIASSMRAAAEIDESQRKTYGETASERRDRERQEHLDKLYGLRIGPSNPTPGAKAAESAAITGLGSETTQQGE